VGQLLQLLNTRTNRFSSFITNIVIPIFKKLKKEGLEEKYSFSLGSGDILDLRQPLHSLLTQTFILTTNRLANMPIKKLRNFEPLKGDEKFEARKKRIICQSFEEALINVAKHAKGATSIEASHELCDNDSTYCLLVKDNGCGLSEASQKSDGTRQMEFAVHQINGKVSIESVPDNNSTQNTVTTWKLELPLHSSI